MKLRELSEKRAALVGKMRHINDHPDGEGGDLSESQSKEFEEYRSSLENLDRQIERLSLIDAADRRSCGVEIATELTDSKFDGECRSFSLTKALGAAAGLQIDAGRECEISNELNRRSGGKFRGLAVPMQVFEKRIITSTDPSTGGNIIATDHRGDQYIDQLRAKTVVGSMGARILSGLVGNLDIPKLKTSATTGWVAENTALTTSDLGFEKISVTPKHVGALTQFSRNMLMQSTPDIEQLIRSDFAALLAREIDSAALTGGGTNQPTGILSSDGLDTSVSMADPSYEKVFELINIVEENDSAVTGFALRPTVKNKLRAAPRSDLGGDGFAMENDRVLAGYPAVSSTQLPSGAIVAGNWSDLIIGYWSAFDLLVNPYASDAYSKGNIQVRAMLTADVAVRHVESFAASLDGPGVIASA